MRIGLGHRTSVDMRLLILLAALAVTALVAAPANAATEGAINHVETSDGAVRVLYSIPGIGKGVEPDLDSVAVTVDGSRADATASLASDSSESVRRTAILAVDVSNSMRGERFEQAKVAAQTYLETVPVDVFVGIVTFAEEVKVVQEPSLDRDASIAVLDTLTLSAKTRLYDGISQAVRTAGDQGQRSVLVLSDGADTSSTHLDDIAEQVEGSDVRVDVVALAQSGRQLERLERIALAGGGQVITADEPEALAGVFASQASALARQLLITVDVPADQAGTEGTLAVSIQAGGETYADSAFVTVKDTIASKPGARAPLGATPPRFEISPNMMLLGLGLATLGGLIVVLSAFGVLSRQKADSLQDRVAAYTLSTTNGVTGKSGSGLSGRPRPESLKTSAVGLAQKALASNKGLESALGARLEAAGMSIKPAEWLLAHAGLSFGAGLVGFLLSSSNLLFTVILVAIGAVAPLIYLGLKRSHRMKAFNGQLPDTLQLMSGSLSAGLSLAQSVDTVVREGTDPMAAEFKRVLVEARLGVEIEEALNSVAGRMQSDDFRWVVMAIRIQREVGGNLAEVLLQVASTMREREYLRRQVKSLSAEGRLSAVILGGLPPVFFLYLLLLRPTYRRSHASLATRLGHVGRVSCLDGRRNFLDEQTYQGGGLVEHANYHSRCGYARGFLGSLHWPSRNRSLY